VKLCLVLFTQLCCGRLFLHLLNIDLYHCESQMFESRAVTTGGGDHISLSVLDGIESS